VSRGAGKEDEAEGDESLAAPAPSGGRGRRLSVPSIQRELRASLLRRNEERREGRREGETDRRVDVVQLLVDELGGAHEGLVHALRTLRRCLGGVRSDQKAGATSRNRRLFSCAKASPSDLSTARLWWMREGRRGREVAVGLVLEVGLIAH
jgi:hypothetical protein